MHAKFGIRNLGGLRPLHTLSDRRDHQFGAIYARNAFVGKRWTNAPRGRQNGNDSTTSIRSLEFIRQLTYSCGRPAMAKKQNVKVRLCRFGKGFFFSAGRTYLEACLDKNFTPESQHFAVRTWREYADGGQRRGIHLNLSASGLIVGGGL